MSDQQVRSAAVVLADRFYLSEESRAELSRLGGFAFAEAKSDQDLAERIGGSSAVKVIVSEYVPVNEVVLGKAPALKGVIAYGAGYDHIDVRALKRRGVKACNCRGENAQAVAELVFGLVLSLLRRIPRAEQWVRTGEWAHAGMALPEWVSGRELWGKTLGIVGLGMIGARVAGIAKGFDMRVIGHDPFTNPEAMGRMGVAPHPLAELLSRSDVLTLHVPLTPQTERLIDAGALSLAKPGMVLVNTSRGRVIDEEALGEALRTGRIAGAALDVFAAEPLPAGHPLARMDNVVLTPHLGALTREAGDRLSASVARQVRAILAGQRPEGLIP